MVEASRSGFWRGGRLVGHLAAPRPGLRRERLRGLRARRQRQQQPAAERAEERQPGLRGSPWMPSAEAPAHPGEPLRYKVYIGGRIQGKRVESGWLWMKMDGNRGNHWGFSRIRPHPKRLLSLRSRTSPCAVLRRDAQRQCCRQGETRSCTVPCRLLKRWVVEKRIS